MWHQALSDHKDLLYIKDIDLEVLAFSEFHFRIKKSEEYLP